MLSHRSPRSPRPVSETARYSPLSTEDPPIAERRPDLYDDLECPSLFVPSPLALGLRRSHVGGLCVAMGLVAAVLWAVGGPGLSVVRSAAHGSELVLVVPKRSGPARAGAAGPKTAGGGDAGAAGVGGGDDIASHAPSAAKGAAAATTTTTWSPTSSTTPMVTTTTTTFTSSASRTAATTTTLTATTSTHLPSTTTMEAPATTLPTSVSAHATTVAAAMAINATTATLTTTTPAALDAPEAKSGGRFSQGPPCHDTRKGESCFAHVAWAMTDGLRDHPEWYAGLDANASFADFQDSVHRFNSTYCPRPCRHHGQPAPSAPPPSTSRTPSAACHDAREEEDCYGEVSWAMRAGIWEHPDWYERVVPESRFQEFQAELHRQNASRCPAPCGDVAATRHYRGVPGASLDLPAVNTPWGSRRELSFYMYRAQSEASFPLENVDAADLAGVMWYLHNEIVPMSGHHRKYNITRILRFKVTMKTTWAFYNVHRRQFSGFVAFDLGRCTVPNCDQIWKHLGFVVGCQFVNVGLAGYLSTTMTRVDGACKEPFCNSPVWYSLPGPCPDSEYSSKTEECKRQMPGGLCEQVTGERNCTYSIEEAGSISLDELEGIEDYAAFFHGGNREYVSNIDGGVGNSFWNGKRDISRCRRRLERAKMLFRKHFPQFPACDDLPPPPCDFDSYFKDEFSWPAYDQPLPGAPD